MKPLFSVKDVENIPEEEIPSGCLAVALNDDVDLFCNDAECPVTQFAALRRDQGPYVFYSMGIHEGVPVVVLLGTDDIYETSARYNEQYLLVYAITEEEAVSLREWADRRVNAATSARTVAAERKNRIDALYKEAGLDDATIQERRRELLRNNGIEP